MPYPGCSGCLGGLQTFDALTATSSELCEAITDPIPGKGWYDDTNGQIGDICAWNFKQVADYTVQLEWSKQAEMCLDCMSLNSRNPRHREGLLVLGQDELVKYWEIIADRLHAEGWSWG